MDICKMFRDRMVDEYEDAVMYEQIAQSVRVYNTMLYELFNTVSHAEMKHLNILKDLAFKRCGFSVVHLNKVDFPKPYEFTQSLLYRLEEAEKEAIGIYKQMARLLYNDGDFEGAKVLEMIAKEEEVYLNIFRAMRVLL